jgi:hypothetical protein
MIEEGLERDHPVRPPQLPHQRFTHQEGKERQPALAPHLTSAEIGGHEYVR